MSGRRRVGFTLIEMLVVMAIVAILMMLLTPVMRAIRNNMRAAQCLNNLKQLHSALTMYEKDYRVLPPTRRVPAPYETWLQRDDADPSAGPETGLLWRYYQDRSILLCPMDNVSGNGVFSYSMPAVLHRKSRNRAKQPDRAPLLIQENPLRYIGSTFPNGTFINTDEPDTVHAGAAGTVYLDGHATMYNWTQYTGVPHAPWIPGTMPRARDIHLEPWGPNEANLVVFNSADN